jgi:hypothetical protein
MTPRRPERKPHTAAEVKRELAKRQALVQKPFEAYYQSEVGKPVVDSMGRTYAFGRYPDSDRRIALGSYEASLLWTLLTGGKVPPAILRKHHGPVSVWHAFLAAEKLPVLTSLKVRDTSRPGAYFAVTLHPHGIVTVRGVGTVTPAAGHRQRQPGEDRSRRIEAWSEPKGPEPAHTYSLDAGIGYGVWERIDRALAKAAAGAKPAR